MSSRWWLWDLWQPAVQPAFLEGCTVYINWTLTILFSYLQMKSYQKGIEYGKELQYLTSYLENEIIINTV